MHAYIHTYIHTYVRTYIHTYIQKRLGVRHCVEETEDYARRNRIGGTAHLCMTELPFQAYTYGLAGAPTDRLGSHRANPQSLIARKLLFTELYTGVFQRYWVFGLYPSSWY
jgi:hypothetical protein